MPYKTYHLIFKGYFRDKNKAGIPAESGVYCVYECAYNRDMGCVDIHRLIYIGEADDARGRIASHEKWSKWKRYVREGNALCFSFAPVKKEDRPRVEAALIFKNKPPVNEEYVDSFPFDRTSITSSGADALLHTPFTVARTE